MMQAKSTSNAVVAGAIASTVAIASALRRRSTTLGAAKRATSSSAVATPPVCAVNGRDVVFGHVEGEERGENPMRPPKMTYDPYFWLRDDKRTDPAVLAHLQAENAYTESMTAHLADTRKIVYDELLSHVKETDSRVPYLKRGYWYYSRTVKGSPYRIYCRRKARKDGDGQIIDDAVNILNEQEKGPGEKASSVYEPEVVMLDLNEIGKGLPHCDLGSLAVSPDNQLLAYSIDGSGDEKYDLCFRDLTTGKQVLTNHTAVVAEVSFGKTNDVLYYTTMDDVHRTDKVWRRVIDTNNTEKNDGTNDECLFTEDDQMWDVGIDRSSSGRYMFIESGSSETSEIHMIDLEEGAKAQPKCMQARSFGVRYDVDHQGDRLMIVTNADGAKNQKLMWCEAKAPARSNWLDVFPYDPAVTVSGVGCFKDHIVLTGRFGGFKKIWLVDNELTKKTELKFDEEVSYCGLGANYEYDTHSLRVSYESLISPPASLQVDMRTLDRTLLRQEPVPNYDASLYTYQRLMAPARDGTLVPMTICYRKDKFTPPSASIDKKKNNNKSSPAPMYLSGYGSYGYSYEPQFSRNDVVLMDHGVVCAVANIRGGGELGRTWYEDEGKYLKKMNTFTDFVDCAEYVVKQGLTTSNRLCIEGASAGGLLMGNVVNLRPDLFKCVIAKVPFVDLMNTMCDSSIPLTTGEWEEWGNPNESKYYNYMLSYSPYDNVTKMDYPAMLVTAGLHDPRVAYWEPAKWVARLRTRKTDTNALLLKVDLDSGHFSASDKYKYLRELAFTYAFMLDQLDIAVKPPL